MSKGGLGVAGVIIIGVVFWYVAGAASHSNKVSQIEDSVGAINFSASIEKKECGGGGIDTSEWCAYTIKAPMTTVIRDLKAAGYAVKGQPRSSSAVLVGGNPETTIHLIELGDGTSLEAKILEEGRTI